jgi:hypothetical protein
VQKHVKDAPAKGFIDHVQEVLALVSIVGPLKEMADIEE